MRFVTHVLAFSFASAVFAQTVYIPSGTGGIGSSSNGNVGIATSAPSQKLEVVGRTRIGDGTNSIEILGGSSGGLTAGHIGTVNNVPLAFFTNYGGPQLTLMTSGNVGIGTTSPSARLDVVGDGSTSAVINARSRQANGYINLVTGTTDDAIGEFAFERVGANAGNIYIGGNAVGNIVFRSGGYAYKLLITSSGNVGIGTTSPTHKLAVNGTIRAKEVVVDTGWSDYVFADDYRLAPLAEIEQHIRAKKHLPGVPSAAEIAADGISLGDMQAKLLAKIEELTLHQIRQEKEILSLKDQLKAARNNRTP